MKIAIASDLHLEFGDIDLKNEEDAQVLILSGDITIANDLHDHPEPVTSPYASPQNWGRRLENSQRTRDFFKRVTFQFPHVIYVAGNHEFYHGKWVGSIIDLRQECGKFPNMYFLERDTKVIDDVTFVGGTLWTDCNKGDPMTLHALADMMTDFRCIRNDDKEYSKLRPVTTTIRHRQTVDYIRHVVRENQENKCVVVGHHAPSSMSVADYYKNQTLMNGGYCSDLSELILDNPNIKLWTHGHMHNNSDYTIGDTRVVCNPRGYIGHEIDAQYFKLQYVEI
jgi:Icc-related predicted phosphoesterase